MYTHASESYRRRLGSLLLYLCYVTPLCVDSNIAYVKRLQKKEEEGGVSPSSVLVPNALAL